MTTDALSSLAMMWRCRQALLGAALFMGLLMAPHRFLFGTDEVAPANQENYLRVYNQYAPLWSLLS